VKPLIRVPTEKEDFIVDHLGEEKVVAQLGEENVFVPLI
jgi:hypothetical protein